MDTRLPEKAVAQAQYTQKKAIPLRKSETRDRGFPLMARNDPRSLVKTPRQEERSWPPLPLWSLQRALTSVPCSLGATQRGAGREAYGRPSKLCLSIKITSHLHFFFLNFNPSIVLEGTQPKQAAGRLTKNNPA